MAIDILSYISVVHIQLNNTHSLTTEPHIRGVRLVVLDHGEELVCRKETLKNLRAFMGSDSCRIFKGRLQLYKHQDGITVEVKGNGLGTIPVHVFKQLLQ